MAPADELKRQLNVRLDAEEEARLERVAKHHGLSGPDLLRMLLKHEEDRLFTRRPTRRKIVQLAFAEREQGHDLTADRASIEFRILPQLARNLLLMLAGEGVFKETTKVDGPVLLNPGQRSFALRQRPLERILQALQATGADLDEDF